MRISTRGRYGLRIVMDIAMHDDGLPRLIRDIAKSQNLSEKYVANLVVKLKAKGILKSILGVHGGYMLNKSATEITLLEVFEAMEGKLSVVKCVACPSVCKKSQDCKARSAWSGINGEIAAMFSKRTVSDVMFE